MEHKSFLVRDKKIRLAARARNPIQGQPLDPTAPIPCNSPEPLDYDVADLDSPRRRAPLIGERTHRACTARLPIAPLDVLVVGGGIHGTGMLGLLRRAGGLRVLAISASDLLAADFFDRLDRLGQTVLRSGYEHHLAPDGALQLIDFAKLHAAELTGRERHHLALHLKSCRSLVPVDVFEGHINHLCAAFALTTLAHHDHVRRVGKGGRARYAAELASGETVEANTVILATGATARGTQPPEGPREEDGGEEGPVLVVGSGLSAAHRVLERLRARRRVHWVVRSAPRFQCSDISHEYFRTEGIRCFAALSCAERAKVLARELRGSISPEFRAPLHAAMEEGALRLHSVVPTPKSWSEVHHFHGFAFDKAAHEALCDLGSLGPLDDETLSYAKHPGLFVCGWAALEAIGPAAKTIDGVRHAAERILPALGLTPPASGPLPFTRSFCLGSRGVGGRNPTLLAEAT